MICLLLRQADKHGFFTEANEELLKNFKRQHPGSREYPITKYPNWRLEP